MAIPTANDFALGEIDSLASGAVQHLRVMHHRGRGPAATASVVRMREDLHHRQMTRALRGLMAQADTCLDDRPWLNLSNAPTQAATSPDRARPEEAAEMSRDQSRYAPGDVFADLEKRKVTTRKQRFAELNRIITEAGGWAVSIPGEREVRFEVLPGSPLPNTLRATGYDVQPDGFGERILPHSVVEWFVRRADGELELLTEGVNQTACVTGVHACRHMAVVEKFWFDLS